MTLKRTKRCYSLDTYFDTRNSQHQHRISNRTIFANYLAARINPESESDSISNKNIFKNLIIHKQNCKL